MELKAMLRSEFLDHFNTIFSKVKNHCGNMNIKPVFKYLV